MEQVPEYKDLTTLTTFFFRDSQLLTHRILLKELNELNSLKIQLSVQVELKKYNENGGFRRWDTLCAKIGAHLDKFSFPSGDLELTACANYL